MERHTWKTYEWSAAHSSNYVTEGTIQTKAGTTLQSSHWQLHWPNHHPRVGQKHHSSSVLTKISACSLHSMIFSLCSDHKLGIAGSKHPMHASISNGRSMDERSRPACILSIKGGEVEVYLFLYCALHRRFAYDAHEQRWKWVANSGGRFGHLFPIIHNNSWIRQEKWYLSACHVCSIGDLYRHVVHRPLLSIQGFCNNNGPHTFVCVERALEIPS